MPDVPDSVSSLHDLMQSRCPMCGAECEPAASVCLSCGEVLIEEDPADDADEKKLRSLISALVGMHILVGTFLILLSILLFAPPFEFRSSAGFALDRVVSVASFLLAIGHFWVAPGVARRKISALRSSMVCSALTAIGSFMTVCFFFVGLLLIAGIAQAYRVIKMVGDREAFPETPD